MRVGVLFLFKKLFTLKSFELKYKLIHTHIRKIEVEQK